MTERKHRDDDRIVELVRVPTRFEAEAIASDLRDNGIEATVPEPDQWLSNMSTWQGNRVLVFESDIDAARALLAGEPGGA
jgi:hypothetical protein